MGKIIENQENVLKNIEELIIEHNEAARYRKKGEEELPAAMLAVLHTDFGAGNIEALGEYFFTPQENCPEDVQYFNCSITLAENIPQDNILSVSALIGILNCYIPYGSFAVEIESKAVIYKLSVPLAVSLSKDKLYEEVNICMAHSIGLAEQYADLLVEHALGEISFEQAVDVVSAKIYGDEE